MDLNLKFLVSDTDRHGNKRFYVRIKGRPKVRLKDTPGSPDFVAAYHAAVAGISPEKAKGVIKGSLAWLGHLYMGSAAFKALVPQGQRARQGILKSCFAEPLKPGAKETMGECPAKRFGPAHARVLRDRKTGLPGAANNRLKWLSAMFGWAVEYGHADVNPIRDVKSNKRNGNGFHTWSEDEVRQFIERHPLGTKAHLAMGLMLFLGVRRSDAVLLGRQHTSKGWVRFMPRKTRKSTGIVLSLPIMPILQRVLDASPCGDLTFLMTSFGKPFTANGFGNWFRDRCDEAGLPHCTAHGLRKAGATIAAENGATDRELMAIYGWASADEATTYTRKAEQKKLAGSAMKLMAGG